jgi:23S rRNA pseudouridine2605 synthase
MSRRSRSNPASNRAIPAKPRYHDSVVSLPRALSKLGLCSRTEAADLIKEGRVTVNNRPVSALSLRVDLQWARIAVDGRTVVAEQPIYLMLNKPRGLVTTRRDPQERGTVYDCLPADLPHLSTVGRLDKASEGLLFLTNDTGWAEYLLNPASAVPKTYHVKIDRVANLDCLAALSVPVIDNGEQLTASAVKLLRSGPRSSWIEVVLTEGRNRQVRRMMKASGANVLRLVRVAIGGIALGELAKGEARPLSAAEVAKVRQVSLEDDGVG